MSIIAGDSSCVRAYTAVKSPASVVVVEEEECNGTVIDGCLIHISSTLTTASVLPCFLSFLLLQSCRHSTADAGRQASSQAFLCSDEVIVLESLHDSNRVVDHLFVFVVVMVTSITAACCKIK